MIKSFRHQSLRALYESKDQVADASLPHSLLLWRRLFGGAAYPAPSALPSFVDVLQRLDSARSIGEVDIPGLRPLPLEGDHGEFWAVPAIRGTEIAFRFEDSHACDLDLLSTP